MVSPLQCSRPVPVKSRTPRSIASASPVSGLGPTILSVSSACVSWAGCSSKTSPRIAASVLSSSSCVVVNGQRGLSSSCMGALPPVKSSWGWRDRAAPGRIWIVTRGKSTGAKVVPPREKSRIGSLAGEGKKKGAHLRGGRPPERDGLERDVVFAVPLLPVALFLLLVAQLLLVAAVAVAVAVRFAAELDHVGDHLDVLAVVVSLALLLPVEAAFDDDRAAFLQVLVAALALLAPDADVEVVGLVDPLAVAVFAAAVHRQAEVGDFVVAFGGSLLRIAGQVSAEDYDVDALHFGASFERWFD